MFNDQEPISGSTFQPTGPAQETPRTKGEQEPERAQPMRVHTMPDRFRQQQKAEKQGGKRNRGLVIAIVILVVVLIGGGVFAYFQFFSAPAATNTTNLNANANANANANSNVNANANANANTNTLIPTIVQGELTDPTTNEILGSATLTIPAGALPASVTNVAVTTLSPKLGAYASTSTQYQPIGGVYIISPANTTLSKSAAMELTYTDAEVLSLNFVVQEEDLTAAYWNGTDWTVINSLVDETENTVTIEVDTFYSDGIAIVVPRSTTTNTNTNTSNTNSSVTPSLDSDQDELTNQEEVLYGTEPGNPDTDGDGYNDGQELLSLYNPNGPGVLADSSLVKKHENAPYRYSILYPTSWAAGSLNADALMVFTSATGEFVQVSVQENTSHLSAREWYLSLNPSVNQSDLVDLAVGTLTGVLGPDKLNVFLADSTYIYQITYNVGTKTEVNYLTTFTMMYTSFRANITPSGSTNTNTTANTNTNSAANTNGA